MATGVAGSLVSVAHLVETAPKFVKDTVISLLLQMEVICVLMRMVLTKQCIRMKLLIAQIHFAQVSNNSYYFKKYKVTQL